MAVLTGLIRPAGPRAFSMAFRLLMQITGRLSAKLALSSGQQMADRTGLRRRAGPPVFFGTCLLLTQTREQPSVAMEPSCERPMEEIPGLARRAIRRALLSQFHLVMQMPAQLWVTRAQLFEQRMPE